MVNKKESLLVLIVGGHYKNFTYWVKKSVTFIKKLTMIDGYYFYQLISFTSFQLTQIKF